MSAILSVPTPQNEPVLSFAPGTAPRAELKAELARMSGEVAEIPCVVGRAGDPDRQDARISSRRTIITMCWRRVHQADADTHPPGDRVRAGSAARVGLSWSFRTGWRCSSGRRTCWPARGGMR